MRKVFNSTVPVQAIINTESTGQYISALEKVVHHYNIFLDDDILEPSNYREMIALLFNAGEEDTFDIFINSVGGDLNTALAIVESLKATRGSVTAILMGACHSAASIIAMYCHEVIVLDSSYSMVHTANLGTQGNTGNVKAHTEFTVRMVEKLLNDTYEGFLTKEELVKIKSGVELWFDADEIKRRMKSRVKFIQAKNRKTCKCSNDDKCGE